LLRITVQERQAEIVVILEGRLEEAWVSELQKALPKRWPAEAADLHLIVDLCGLTGVDQGGESVLETLYERGAILRCADVMNGYLVERIEQGAVKPLQAPCRPCHWIEKERRPI